MRTTSSVIHPARSGLQLAHRAPRPGHARSAGGPGLYHLVLLLLLSLQPSASAADAEEKDDAAPALTEVYRLLDHQTLHGEIRLVAHGSEENPRATLLVETDAGFHAVEVNQEGARVTPLGLSSQPSPAKGLVTVDDIAWFGHALIGVARASGKVYERPVEGLTPPPYSLGLRRLEKVFIDDSGGRVIGVRGTRIASLALSDGNVVRRTEPALKEANHLCVDPPHGFAIYGVGTIYLDLVTLQPAPDNGQTKRFRDDCSPKLSYFTTGLLETISGGRLNLQIQEKGLDVGLEAGDETVPLWHLPGVTAMQRVGPHLLLVTKGGRAVGWWRDFSREAAARAKPSGICDAGDCVNGIGALRLKEQDIVLVGAFKDGYPHGLAARLERGGRASGMGVWERGRYVSSLPDGHLVAVVFPGPEKTVLRGGIDRYGNRSGVWVTSRAGVIEKAEVFREGGLLGTCVSPDHCLGTKGSIRTREWFYDGALKDGLPHGKGRWTWSENNRRFEGTFEEGYPVEGEDWGLGRMLFSGRVRKDFTHDYGKTPMPDGSGSWIGPHDARGLPHGQGKFISRKGKTLTAVAEHGKISRPD